MSLQEKWNKAKDDFQESIDGLKDGVSSSTFGSFVQGALGGGEMDVDSPSEHISKMPIVGGETLRKTSKKTLSWMSEKSHSAGKSVRYLIDEIKKNK